MSCRSTRKKLKYYIENYDDTDDFYIRSVNFDDNWSLLNNYKAPKIFNFWSF